MDYLQYKEDVNTHVYVYIMEYLCIEMLADLYDLYNLYDLCDKWRKGSRKEIY